MAKAREKMNDEETFWVEFFEDLKKGKAHEFRRFCRVLDQFISAYPEDSCYVTLDDLQAVLSEMK